MKISVVSLLLLVAVYAQGANVPIATPVFPEDVKASTNSVSRIISGTSARAGQFPWQVAIYFYLPTGRYFCGGSLISSQWVLTAAHCAINAFNFTVYLGSITTGNQELERVTIYTARAYVHEDYNERTLNNDIALIDLGIEIGTNERVKPIRLPSRGDVVGSSENLEVSGWGIVTDGSSGVYPTLNYVQLRSISNSACRNYFGSTTIISSTLCAVGDTTQSTCSGDSGGGLITRDTEEPTLVGVVSFVSNSGCALGYPSGYVRTESYLEWIEANTGLSL